MSNHRESWRQRRKMQERPRFERDVARATTIKPNFKDFEGTYTRDESRAGIAWGESDKDSRL